METIRTQYFKSNFRWSFRPIALQKRFSNEAVKLDNIT